MISGLSAEEQHRQLEQAQAEALVADHQARCRRGYCFARHGLQVQYYYTPEPDYREAYPDSLRPGHGVLVYRGVRRSQEYIESNPPLFVECKVGGITIEVHCRCDYPGLHPECLDRACQAFDSSFC
nr:E3 12.5K protein [Lemur mastadenovirus]